MLLLEIIHIQKYDKFILYGWAFFINSKAALCYTNRGNRNRDKQRLIILIIQGESVWKQENLSEGY